MNSVEARDIVLLRVVEDLMGPDNDGEELPQGTAPTEKYLTGILYPQQSTLDPDQAEDRTVEEGRGSESYNSEGADEVQIGRSWLPSSVGVSFLVVADGADLELSVDISMARYHFRDTDGDEGGAKKWVREPLVAEHVPVTLVAGQLRYPKTLEEYGISGCRLFVRWRELGGQHQFTVCAINAQVNDGSLDFQARNEACFFQCQLKVWAGEGVAFVARTAPGLESDEAQRINSLIYRDVPEFATGHTCAATWEDKSTSPRWVATTWVPVEHVDDVDPEGDSSLIAYLESEGRSGYLAEEMAAMESGPLVDLLNTLPDAYGTWLIRELDEKLDSLSGELRPIAEQQANHVRDVIKRMEGSIACLQSNQAALTAFRLANHTMARQARWKSQQLRWRPFQIGFALLTIESLVLRDRYRDVMDLIWFPTGGGKTEAYLLLMAFVLFYRRLEAGGLNHDDGVGVLTRYTLRALTTDQFERTVALVCAAELVRHEAEPEYEDAGPISLGLWVGGGATPNNFEDAKRSLEGDYGPTPKVVTSCPACGGTLRWWPDDTKKEVVAECESRSCEVGGGLGRLPIHTVDEQIYAHRPSIVIGTVDKFVQIARFPTATDRLFNRGCEYRPPDMILQDELHLLSGPLGTTAGLMELGVDWLCSGVGHKPKLIGSTATIQRASEQVGAIFDRKVCQFPPAVIDADNSFFAVRKTQSPGRRYVGITTAGKTPTFMLQAVAGSLLQAVRDEKLVGHPRAADPYSTFAAYFNSLRILGGARTLLWEDAQKSKGVFATLRGEEPREINDLQELTSAVSQEELREALARLRMPYGSEGHVDMLLASVMLSVGVDIPRLGLMLVDGQPKTMAEYIQATSRVGRGDIPGLIVTLYNNSKARDRSHYEAFRGWHGAFYRHVEATSATPFASRARDKGLKSLLVALSARTAGLTERDATLTEERRNKIEEEVVPLILSRVDDVDPDEREGTQQEIEEFLEEWESKGPLSYLWNDYEPNESLFVSAERAAQGRAIGRVIPTWAAPNSMRDVEPEVMVRVYSKL